MPSLTDEPDPRTADVLPYPENPSESFQTKVYLVYLALDGNEDATARACNVSPAFVRDYAAQQDWHSRIDAVTSLCSGHSRGPAELERLLNRASLYVQAMRLRRLIDATLSEVETAGSSGDNGLLGLFTVHTKEGSRLDLKPLSDLAQAVTKLAAMAQNVMCDTPTERVKRMSAQDPEGLQDTILLGKRTLDALSNIPARAPNSETVALEAAVAARQSIDEQVAKNDQSGQKATVGE